jgi:hypothetical protein
VFRARARTVALLKVGSASLYWWDSSRYDSVPPFLISSDSSKFGSQKIHEHFLLVLAPCESTCSIADHILDLREYLVLKGVTLPLFCNNCLTKQSPQCRSLTLCWATLSSQSSCHPHIRTAESLCIPEMGICEGFYPQSSPNSVKSHFSRWFLSSAPHVFFREMM